jgi:methylthioribose-1-phosphate isomerase (EC 5.3.1.23)
VIIGADRIAANGDTANKIGSYTLAVLARFHRIPLYVTAPRSTFDLRLKTGRQIPVEQRDAAEVRSLWFKRPMAAEGVKIYNPAFDIIPAGLISGIVTETGIITPPYTKNIRSRMTA